MRPTQYNSELASQIARTIATSATRLAELCEVHTHWPTKDTIVKWIHEHEEFADLIIEALEMRDGIDVLDMVDDESRPIKEIETK